MNAANFYLVTNICSMAFNSDNSKSDITRAKISILYHILELSIVQLSHCVIVVPSYNVQNKWKMCFSCILHWQVCKKCICIKIPEPVTSVLPFPSRHFRPAISVLAHFRLAISVPVQKGSLPSQVKNSLRQSTWEEGSKIRN